MAWIEWLEAEEADGELRDIYRSVGGRSGFVANILKIHSLNPAALRGHYEFYRTLMYGKSGLSRAQREMLAVAVSRANDCHY